MVMNVFGNWLLIGGNLGAPALGVVGAAWASTIATTLAFLGLFVRFLRDGRAFGRIVPRLRMAELARMLRYGLPSGFNWFFEFFAFNFFVNVVVAGLGTTALAALMAVLQLNSAAFMPAFGLASAGAILVGQSIGAGRKDDVPRAVKLTFLVAGSWQGLVSVAYVVLPGLLMRPFVNPAEGTALLVVGIRMLMLSAAWQLFDAAAMTLGEALRAAGDTAFTLWARVSIAWLVFVPGSLATVWVFGGGDVAAVLWVVLYLAILAGVLFLRFAGGAWRRIELVETPVAG
jgi:MATE family multidrug resistance protein